MPDAVEVAGKTALLVVFLHEARIPLRPRAKNLSPRFWISEDVQRQPRRDVFMLLLRPRSLGSKCPTGVALYLLLEILESGCLKIRFDAALARGLAEWLAAIFPVNPHLVESRVLKQFQSRLLEIVLTHKKKPLCGRGNTLPDFLFRSTAQIDIGRSIFVIIRHDLRFSLLFRIWN